MIYKRLNGSFYVKYMLPRTPDPSDCCAEGSGAPVQVEMKEKGLAGPPEQLTGPGDIGTAGTLGFWAE